MSSGNRRPEKRHHHHRKDRMRSGALAAVAAACVIVLTVLLILLNREENKQTVEVVSAPEETEIVEVGGIPCVPKQNLKTYLFMGIDDTASSGETFVTGGQCDVLQVIVVDRAHRSYRRLAINRNTMMDLHSFSMDGEDLGTTYSQIALAHSSGDGGPKSCEYTVRAVSEYLMGAEIDRYVAAGTESISAVNHVLGGVTVTIEDDFSQSDPSLVMGETVTLTDEQAEHFVRGRMNVGDGTNESRMRRQEAYLHAAREKTLELLKEDSDFFSELHRTFQELTVTDMSDKEFGRLVNVLMTYQPEEEVTIAGSVGEDEFGFATFESEPDSVRDAVIALFFNRAETVDS